MLMYINAGDIYIYTSCVTTSGVYGVACTVCEGMHVYFYKSISVNMHTSMYIDMY